MKLSVHGRRVLATVSALVLLVAMIPLSTLTLSALQTKAGREDLLAEHGGFDSASDFGTGKFWYPEGNNTAEAVRSETEGQNGSGALKLTRDGSGQAFVYATVSVTPGEEYTLSYYKKTTARLVAYITVRDNGSTAIERQDAAMNEYADWTRMTLSFTAPTSGKIRIDIGLNAGTGTALFDSFSLVSRTETTGSYLFNGDFEQENHTANWNGITGDDLTAIDATGGLDGSAALKIKNGGATVYSNKIDVTPDTAYTFSLWRKKDAPVQAYVQVFEFDAAGNLLGAPSTGRNYLTGTGTASDWQQYTFTHTMQSKTASMRLQILANAGSGAAWFDDITVTTSFKATEIPASALTLSESKAENGVSTFTFAVNGVTLPQSETALVNADPLQKLVTKDYRYLFGATVDTADRTDLKLVADGDSLTLQFADNDQSVYAVQKNAKKIVLPAETTFLDPTDVAKGYRLAEAVILYRNADGWSTTCKHSYDSYQRTTEPTCAREGTEKLTCSLCGYENTRNVEKDATAHGDKLHAVTAEPATCTETGIAAHWHCDGCGNNYSDEAGTVKLNDVTEPINATAHGDKLHAVTAEPATCTETGIAAHWHCDGCGNDYSDAAGTMKLDDVTEPINATAHGDKLHAVSAVAATCTETGIVAHWHCDGCGNNYSDEAGTVKLNDVTEPINATAHGDKLHAVSAVAATCAETGIMAHWHCDGCGNNYSDAAGTVKLNDVTEPIDATAHGEHLKMVNAVEATHETSGNILYYHCEECDRYFRDAAATEEITKADTVIPHGEHTYADKWSVDTENHWKECTCGSKTALGKHTFGAWTVTKQPTATEKGERECVCTVCGTPMREELPTVENKPSATPSEKPNDETPTTGVSTLPTVLAVVFAGVAFLAMCGTRRRKQA